MWARTPNFIDFPVFHAGGQNTGPQGWGQMFRFSREKGIPYTINILIGLTRVLLQSPLKLLTQHSKRSIYWSTAQLWLKELWPTEVAETILKVACQYLVLKKVVTEWDKSLIQFTNANMEGIQKSLFQKIQQLSRSVWRSLLYLSLKNFQF